MKITKRERFLLFEALEHYIHRYLMSCTYGREDGNEKAEQHLKISSILVSFILLKKYNERKHFEAQIRVHDYLAEILTDRMDEVIGFPLDRRIYNYDEYVNRFFCVIVDNLDEIKKIIQEN